jgi:hypothetical protein
MRDLARYGVLGWVVVAVATACRTASPGVEASAEAIIEGAAPHDVRIDTTDVPFRASLDRASWRVKPGITPSHSFWTDVADLDIESADADAKDFDERTFAAGLRRLMASDPEAAAVAFHALTRRATNPLVRAYSRAGLTMALSWYSEWRTIAELEREPSSDSAFSADLSTRGASVERWAHAFADAAPPTVSFSKESIILPLRRSTIGTPVTRVMINGKPHEFWLDTGASMTVVSSSAAATAGIRLVANDTLSLGVVGGDVDARAAVVDSISIGGFTARGVAAALVDSRTLHLDYKRENGILVPVTIDGVIGADLLRRMDLVIDVANGTIAISKPQRDVHSVRNLFWVGFPVVRLTARDGHPLLFGLDTGAESTYVTMGFLRKLPRTRVATRRGQIGGLGGQKEKTEWVVREAAVSDGKYAMTMRNASISPDYPWNFVNFDGIIGSDIALGARLHLDFENGVFDIRPSAVATAKRE